MGIIRLYYPTGEIKYCGYKRGKESKNVQDKDDIFLHLFQLVKSLKLGIQRSKMKVNDPIVKLSKTYYKKYYFL